ncbi:J domain-containing protein [uncultured Desulfosarcina sp.]|uniref:J domain-containing protein n=1 Tax=uncultured Desulfosarcina sp. TaxID=218289 RepID=UPI0029C6E1F6|nr:J domain-containing protein [uncultured Desulfosarcina sp.]
MNLLTSFKILGLPSDADEIQAKRAYKAQVRRWHPDQFPEESGAKAEAEEQLKQINIAYAQIKEHLAAHGPSPASPASEQPPRPDTADRARPASEQQEKKSWFDALFDTLNAFSAAWHREPSSSPTDQRPPNRRQNFGEILDEMAGGTISPPKGRNGKGIRRKAAGYRRYRGGSSIDAVGSADRVGPVRPVGRVRGIGRRR